MRSSNDEGQVETQMESNVEDENALEWTYLNTVVVEHARVLFERNRVIRRQPFVRRLREDEQITRSPPSCGLLNLDGSRPVESRNVQIVDGFPFAKRRVLVGYETRFYVLANKYF